MQSGFDDEYEFYEDDFFAADDVADLSSKPLRLRLKTATVLVAVGLLAANPASAQVVVGRAGSGPDVQVVSPPRSTLPPEWLRHIPKATGGKPYQPSRINKQQSAHTPPAALPVRPSSSYDNAPALRAPQLNSTRQSEARRGVAARPLDANAPGYVPPAEKQKGLMAAPWSPRAQHIERPLFPELLPEQADKLATDRYDNAVLAAPRLGGAKPTITREQTTLPPVLTPDLMSSLRQAGRDEAMGLPPRMPREEGNGINASSGQDKSQMLGTVERWRVEDVVAEREARESGRPYQPRRRAPEEPNTPVPPAPIPTPAPASSVTGYLPPRGREDEVLVPPKSALSGNLSDSLAPLDKGDEITVRVEDAPPAAEGRRVLGRVGDSQKATVYNAPRPLPSAGAAPSPADAGVVTQGGITESDEKAFKAEGRKLFSAGKKKTKEAVKDTKASAQQLSLFDAAELQKTKAADGGTLTKLPDAPVHADDMRRSPNALLTITPQGTEEAALPAAETAPGSVQDDAKTVAVADGAREIREVPVNSTPFGDTVIASITANGADVVDSASPAASDAVPDITKTQDAPKILGKGPRKVAAKAPAAKVAAPAPTPVVPPADDEIRVVVDEPKDVVDVPKAAPKTEPYTPPAKMPPAEYRSNTDQVLRAPERAVAKERSSEPVSLAPVTRAAPPAPLAAPRAVETPADQQLYVKTPAAQPGDRVRLKTPKLVLGKDVQPQATAAVAAPDVAPDVAPSVAVEPTVIERPQLTPPPEPQIQPVVIEQPRADIQLRMPGITFGPTERDLDAEGEAQTDLLAQQMASNPGRRLTLVAYAQAPNLNEARRVALGRALAIRSRLAEYGIQPIRVSIRALGALPPGDRGSPDRVDTILQ